MRRSPVFYFVAGGVVVVLYYHLRNPATGIKSSSA